MMNILATTPRPGFLFVCAALFLSTTLLTGCADGVFTAAEDTTTQRTVDTDKFRQAHLLDRALRAAPGKSASSGTLGLIIGVQSGVDKQKVVDRYRIADRYKVANRYRVSHRYSYDNVFNGFAWTIEDSLGLSDYQEFLDTLALDPDIIWFEPDFDVNSPPSNTSSSSSTQQVPWSVAAIGGQMSWTVSGDGQGDVNVQVYVLDTGVTNDDLDLVEHADFREGLSDATDHDGHGTHVAGIIGAIDDSDGLVGLAPGTRIHNHKVLGDDGRGDISQVIASLELITTTKINSPSTPMVINLSLGEDIGPNAHSALDDAVEAAVAAGVTVVVAAGNHGKNASGITPAKVESAITVGAYSFEGAYSSFSNYGPKVDLLAPGEDIVSMSPAGSGHVVEMTGTSMAAAHVTGAAALYLAHHPTASPSQVLEVLLDDAKDFVTGAPSNTTNKSVWVGLSMKEGLLSHWRLNESSGTTAADAQGPYPGQLANGAQWAATEGVFDGALRFDGVDDYVDLGTPDLDGTALSILFWFKADDFGVTDGRFISKGFGIQNYEHYWMVSTIDDGTALRFRLRTGGSVTMLKSQTGLYTANTWHAVAATYDGSHMRIYLDGQVVAQTSKTGTLDGDPTVHAALGNQPFATGGKAFDGLLDDVRIYNRALSQAEVAYFANPNNYMN